MADSDRHLYTTTPHPQPPDLPCFSLILYICPLRGNLCSLRALAGFRQNHCNQVRRLARLWCFLAACRIIHMCVSIDPFLSPLSPPLFFLFPQWRSLLLDQS
ncbi:hypothetical protein ASPZODRAFT_822478 [Penicilliopsis zonata CBS 506.65]|uniref:Uncharacterized protein n=1 Tax=Penicilliopsis zonata CBS 506.65 TaxID=1073090 RepID=A0A1L9SA66_9EURO|nr:hypothetical protein ASPZODRAFT_822478 [Penicilliopsis zonata CBS 506.65]OJJ44054.1 hypothetical protein ASPZODRAFT_822478 [Penicilliopsis zonata CBS 506.65]